MSKKIKIAIKDIEKLEYELKEPANSGDYFSLLDGSSIDFMPIRKMINEHKSQYIDEIKNSYHQQWLNEFKQSPEFVHLLEEKQLLKNQLDIANTKREQEVKIALQNQEIIFAKKVNELEKKVQEKTNDLTTEKNNFISQLNQQALKIKNEMNVALKNKELAFYEQQKKWISLEKDLQNQIDNLKNNQDKTINIAIKEKELAYETQINQYKLQLQSLDHEKNDLNREHQIEIDKLKTKHENELVLIRNQAINSKIIGEGLEIWVHEQYNLTFGLSNDCRFYKDNVSIKDDDEAKGTKADFIFETYNGELNEENLLTRVVIECKTQGLSAIKTNSKKNSDFYKKLEIDCEKKRGHYAVLVTELEPEINFVIMKINEYKNLYVMRPQYLMTFLSLIHLFSKTKKLILNKQIDFRKKQAILDEFNELKNNILNTTIQKIKNRADNILKNVATIEKQTKEIRENMQIIVDTYINTLVNKIEDFKINKITNKLEKVEEQKIMETKHI